MSKQPILDIATCPKDNTLVRLLVINDDSPLIDGGPGHHWTIGSCGFDDNGDPDWSVVGWDWCQDQFVTSILAITSILGWQPFEQVED
jgi:hypothetical protein